MLPTDEQETNINFLRNEDVAEVYTSDSTTITKLDKAVEAGTWKLKQNHYLRATGELIGKTYEAPKEFISFRTRKRTMSDEQRQALSERMKANNTKINSITQNQG